MDRLLVTYATGEWEEYFADNVTIDQESGWVKLRMRQDPDPQSAQHLVTVAWLNPEHVRSIREVKDDATEA